MLVANKYFLSHEDIKLITLMFPLATPFQIFLRALEEALEKLNSREVDWPGFERLISKALIKTKKVHPDSPEIPMAADLCNSIKRPLEYF